MGASRIRFTLLAGPRIPVPVGPDVLTALEKVEVRQSEEEASGFQIVVSTGRGRSDRGDQSMLGSALSTGARAILMVTLGGRPHVLIDGFVVHQELTGGGPGGASLALTGRDVTFAMDRKEEVLQHPAQSAPMIVTKILGSYPELGLIPQVVPPPSYEVPAPTEKVASQQMSDLEYVQYLAKRYASVFFVTPGDVPGTNYAYWGPVRQQKLPLPPLSADMGAESNVTNLTFKNDPSAAKKMKGKVQDSRTNEVLPVLSGVLDGKGLSAINPLAAQSLARETIFRPRGAIDAAEAFATAQAQALMSTDVVEAEGELDSAVYGSVLRPRQLVPLRGAGKSFNGLWRVKSVSHELARSSYVQKFKLVREGLGSTLSRIAL